MAIADFSENTLQELISLEGRAAVVTGGARGLGLAICSRLSEAGALVVVADLDGGAAEKAASRISENGGNALGVEVDATDSGSLSELADRTVSEYGRLDIWVNNAGVYPFQDPLEMSDEDWKKVVDLNLSGSFYGSREAAKRMREAGNGGVIINLSSTAGYKAEGPSLAHYVSTKHGVRGLTKSLAVALGGDGIRVLALAPTLIATEGIGEARGSLQEMTGSDDPLEAFSATLPLGRAGVADDVARVALFCASDLSGFMTGSTLLVDAGGVAL